MAHSDLASHIEFCGTRTEACPRCGNFIMHKDLNQHNSSNCTYPETKPPASNTNGFRNHGGGDDFRFPASHGAFGEIFGGPFRGLHGSFNPFEFEELRQALEGDADGRGMPSAVAEDSDASAAAEGSRLRRGGGFGVWRNPAVPRQKKNNTQGGARKATTNRRSEVNRQREQGWYPLVFFVSVMVWSGEVYSIIHLTIMNSVTIPNSETCLFLSNTVFAQCRLPQCSCH